MNQELLDIYDEHMNHVGIASRQVVHEKGYWHRTFHCWIIRRNRKTILFQRRTNRKDIYPNLFSVTASGHLMAGESAIEGFRELEEELGIKVSSEDLAYLGSVKETLHYDSWLDRAFYHVFMYECNLPLKQYRLQPEEVDGLIEINIEDACKLFRGEMETASAVGFEMDQNGNHRELACQVRKTDFVPHDDRYYLHVLKTAERYCQRTDRSARWGMESTTGQFLLVI